MKINSIIIGNHFFHLSFISIFVNDSNIQLFIHILTKMIAVIGDT